MKTMKLIVLCLSLFLGCQLTYAQKKSQKQERYDQLVQQLKVIDNLIKQYENQPILSKKDSANLDFHRKTRAARSEEMKNIERQIQIEENAKRLLQEQMQMTKEELDAEKQKIRDLTRRYWAKKIDWHTYVDLIFGNRSQISFNGKKYAVGLWDYEIYNKDRAIDHNNSEMKIIRDNFCNDVYKMTGNVFKPDIDREDLVVSPDAPSHFSTWVNGNVKKLTGKPLPPATKKEIQKQFNSAAAQQATLESQNEKIAAEVKKLTGDLKELQKLCPGC